MKIIFSSYWQYEYNWNCIRLFANLHFIMQIATSDSIYIHKHTTTLNLRLNNLISFKHNYSQSHFNTNSKTTSNVTKTKTFISKKSVSLNVLNIYEFRESQPSLWITKLLNFSSNHWTTEMMLVTRLSRVTKFWWDFKSTIMFFPLSRDVEAMVRYSVII